MSALGKASLVIPVGSDDARLAGLVDELASRDLGSIEVVIVDNSGSATTTPGFARAAERWRVVRETTRGKGAAVRAGMLAATRDLRVFTDVDLPYGWEGVERVVTALDAGRAPIAVGSRLVEGASARGRGLLRGLMSGLFRRWVAWCVGADLGDTQCGIKGFTAAVARDLFAALVTREFAFDVEVLARARLAGLTIEPVAVVLRASKGPSSIRVVRDSLRMFADAWRVGRLIAKERARGR